ncbi:uncharacterized protein LOC120122772 [Hibiscus syriacus]|uniref:uncharacterized protein LOC120122772 n=1 Tax=Hibiscus syriacus TaxID=106335 RepID=UPI001923CE66|nr:uncharacterized protein LOC120122772 [Hibiscus syriacus]
MAFAYYSIAVPFGASKRTQISIPPSFCSTESSSSLAFTSSRSSPFPLLSIFPRINRIGLKAKAEPQESEVNLAAEPFTQFKHLLLPITDSNPYLSEGTRQAATTAALAKKNGADITVVGMFSVICQFQFVCIIKGHICLNVVKNDEANSTTTSLITFFRTFS